MCDALAHTVNAAADAGKQLPSSVELATRRCAKTDKHYFLLPTNFTFLLWTMQPTAHTHRDLCRIGTWSNRFKRIPCSVTVPVRCPVCYTLTDSTHITGAHWGLSNV